MSPRRSQGLTEFEEINFRFEYADSDDVWEAIVRIAGPLAEVINNLGEEERDATRAAILENLAEFRDEDGSYSAPAASWGVLSVR